MTMTTSTTTQARVTECPECNGVMKSGWSDGKTRMHGLTCLRCDHQADKHQRDLRYLELRHADAFAELDTEQDYDEFITAFERLRRDLIDEAFTPNITWRVVKIRHNSDGTYTVAAYDDCADEGEGVGEDDCLPHGTPDVSWSADMVFLNDSEIEMVDVNDGSAWFYLSFVSDITIYDGRVDDTITISV